MSIEETYKGQWSSDPDLLKSLLDAGNTIVTNHGSVTWADGLYWISTAIGPMPKSYESDSHLGFSFLIPPRPLVLEPKPLEWTINEDKTESLCSQGDWFFEADSDGAWGIVYSTKSSGSKYMGGVDEPSEGDMDTAKAAIQEWRVNHLKSMLP